MTTLLNRPKADVVEETETNPEVPEIPEAVIEVEVDITVPIDAITIGQVAAHAADLLDDPKRWTMRTLADDGHAGVALARWDHSYPNPAPARRWCARGGLEHATLDPLLCSAVENLLVSKLGLTYSIVNFNDGHETAVADYNAHRIRDRVKTDDDRRKVIVKALRKIAKDYA